jgi:hypothetical protein
VILSKVLTRDAKMSEETDISSSESDNAEPVVEDAPAKEESEAPAETAPETPLAEAKPA